MQTTELFEAAQRRLFELHDIDVNRRFVQVPGIGQTHVMEVGSGPPVLFMIGGGAPGAMWAPLVASLDGFRRIMVDRPGFGLTTPVRHRRGQLRSLARTFLSGVLDALELERTAVVANSMGAWWSIQFALVQPDRIAAMTSIGCPALLLETGAPLPMRLIGVRGLGELLLRLPPGGEAGARQTMSMMNDPLGDSPADEAMAGLMSAITELPDYRRTWVDLLDAFVTPRGPRPEMSITEDDLHRLPFPLQFVWGESDPFGGRDVGQRAAAIAPAATFEPVPGGHVPWVTHTQAVADPVAGFLHRHMAEAPRS